MFARKAPSVISTRPPSSKTAVGKGVDSPSSNQQSSGSNNNTSHTISPALLGQIDATHLQLGTKVWVADAKVLWRIGEVQAIAEDRKSAEVYLPDAVDDQVQTLRMDQLFTFDASHIVDHADVALMNNMHEAPLLNVLRQRFEKDQIYTFTADILLSINPYKSIPLLYDVVGFMKSREEAAAATGDGSTSDSSAPPHLFSIAEKAYTGMKGVVSGSGAPQSIIISGESGAGKTEASKYIMKYLATASKHVANIKTTASAAAVHEQIEECVVLSNLILESFGNAKTSRNDNSSRFGKYIQIHYNSEGRMAGVSIRHFLLEKTRLVRPETNERNYHIFYQLLAGLDTLSNSDADRPLLLRNDVWNYTYLTRGDCVEVDGVDDAIEFEQLRRCLEQLGMDSANFQRPMFEVLAAILHLGNVQFESRMAEGGDSRDESTEEEPTRVVFPESDDGVNLEHVAMLLGVDAVEFANKMVTQTTITGRGSILEIKLTPEQAKNAMDAFCKYLYGELFHHVIARINACARQQTSPGTDKKTPKSRTQGGATAPSVAPFIGILDIFGFEVMKRNSLEQLCINFTNETLQQQFNKHVFVLEQERYAREGIAVSPVEFQDNQRCLDLIQKPPLGLLPLLEEQMLLKRKTTDKQLLTIYHGNHLDKHPSYAKPRFECDEFIIRHYAGDVTYDIHDFIAKNTDNLHDDLLDLLRRSSQSFLQAMFSAPAASALGGAATKRGAPSTPTGGQHKRTQSASLTGTTTVSSRFRTQLAELMEVLWSTTPSYIKCIKPNNLKFAGGFTCELVRDQLVYSGVLEVVRIRQEGFPIRKLFGVFYELFWPLVIKQFGVAETRDDAAKIRQACEVIAREWLKDKDLECEAKSTKEDDEAPEGEKGETEPKPTRAPTRQIFAMGRNEVFLRYGQVERLEGALATLRQDSIVILQSKLVRSRLTFKKFHMLRKATVKCQALWRMRVQRATFLKQRTSAIFIQASFRGIRLYTLFQKKKRAADVMTRVSRRYVTRCSFLRLVKATRAATEIQRHIRGFMLRTAAERERKMRVRATLKLQSWQRMHAHRRTFLIQRRAAVCLQTKHRDVVRQRRETA
ncbi:hypothetical protein BBJ29_005023 [Phytophthora kernoviae]|uniref:Myosin motor domain-containing protein n=1 Tax=Phytophthora kernoviae TaxID=325452 RepID=A0A3F2RUY2_9STRA|nr:hypothetical protein BBJ29_005023 [Phytophthora kernoviae]RLN64702.1 hypothetical protein BBP00_00003302 [Phytophthora kernoviae]